MTQLAGRLSLEMLKYFEVMLNIFEFFHVKKIVESRLLYVNKFFDRDNRAKLVPASFSYFLGLFKRENIF